MLHAHDVRVAPPEAAVDGSRHMAHTAEQKRDRRAQRKRDRAAEDELRGVKRQPRGGVPLYHRWDESAGAWVLDEAGKALEQRQLPPLPSRPADLNAWAAANPPPSRRDFATQELFDEAREPWYAMLMGKRLPPYGQNKARRTAWGIACTWQVDRTIWHNSAEERAAKKAEQDAAAAAQKEAQQKQRAAAKAREDALKQRLIDCERRNVVEYHDACGKWHHLRVPCEEAHLWPMCSLPENFKEKATGTLFVEGTGPVQGARTPEECEKWICSGCTGNISRAMRPWHGPWPWQTVMCACLPEDHPWWEDHLMGRLSRASQVGGGHRAT